MENIKARYVSVWDDGTTVETECEIDLLHRKVVYIESSDVDGLDILKNEYVEIEDEQFPVVAKDEFDDDDWSISDLIFIRD